MNKGQKKRIKKLEKVLNPPKQRRFLRTFSNQYGLDGEVVRDETDEQVIAKHLAEHPEDAGLEFNIMNIIWVSPDNKHVE
jgi:hypothetical protein